MSKITFKQLAGQKRTIKIDIPDIDDQLDVTYIPGKITPKFWASLNDLINDEQSLTFSRSKVLQVCEFVDSWSIVDENDKPLPVNETIVSELPSVLLDIILTAIQEDLYPPNKNEKKS